MHFASLLCLLVGLLFIAANGKAAENLSLGQQISVLRDFAL
jgi:hypothetical protein